jgi:hypothetical protein
MTTETRPVTESAAWMPVTLELLVDSGQATPGQMAEYHARRAAQREALRSVPMRYRVAARLWLLRWRVAERIHARFTDHCEREW